MGVARAVLGSRGGYLTTSGRLRIGVLEGKTYVIGRGRAIECADMGEARKKLDAAIADEKTARDAKKAARARALEVRAASVVIDTANAQAAVSGAKGLVPGARIRFALLAGGPRTMPGSIEEVGTRSILVTDDEGNPYRRAPSDVEIGS